MFRTVERMNGVSILLNTQLRSTEMPSAFDEHTALRAGNDTVERTPAKPTICRLLPQEFVGSVAKLFDDADMRKMTLILWWVWFSASLGYYGLVLLVGNLHYGNLKNYASSAIITSSEYPSYVLQYILGTYIGRRATFTWTSAPLVVCFPVLSLLREFAHAQTVLRIAATYVTRLIVTTLFDMAWMFTPEAYPTDIRSTGYGLCSAMARLSGIISPYVALPLFHASRWGATGLFCLVFAVSACLASRLPYDTRGRPLKESRD